MFAVAEARVGAVPLVEPAEEIRALLLRLCCTSLAKESARGFGYEVPTVPNTLFCIEFESFLVIIGRKMAYLWSRSYLTCF